MKVLTQRNGSKSLDLRGPPMIAPYAATTAPTVAKLAKPSLNNCTSRAYRKSKVTVAIVTI